MAWWGKLIGGTVGFLVGGPLGALLGASFGHNFDGGTATRGGYQSLPGDQERTQAAFFTATFSIMGHLAKSDGKVTQQEIDLANALMREMDLGADQRKLAQTLFNQGKQPDFDFDAIVNQFKVECHRRTTLLRMFLEIQVQAAFADNRLDPAENRLLIGLCQRLGFQQAELDRIIDMVRGSNHAHSQGGQPDIADAYQILGVKPDTPIDDIRKAYRRLLSQHHPDKLVSRGLPEEMIRLANEKTHEIQSAWQRIKEARGS